MNPEQIARIAAMEMLRNFGGQTFTREYAVISEQIVLSAIERATETVREYTSFQITSDSKSRQIQAFPSNQDEARAITQAQDEAIDPDSRAAPASAEQQDCKHHWRRVVPIAQEQCSICKAFKYPQCNHAQPQKEFFPQNGFTREELYRYLHHKHGLLDGPEMNELIWAVRTAQL